MAAIGDYFRGFAIEQLSSTLGTFAKPPRDYLINRTKYGLEKASDAAIGGVLTGFAADGTLGYLAFAQDSEGAQIYLMTKAAIVLTSLVYSRATKVLNKNERETQ